VSKIRKKGRASPQPLIEAQIASPALPLETSGHTAIAGSLPVADVTSDPHDKFRGERKSLVFAKNAKNGTPGNNMFAKSSSIEDDCDAARNGRTSQFAAAVRRTARIGVEGNQS
jgi:hypothetical protein